MATIKIGKAEEELFEKIVGFTEIYEERLKDIIFGLELAERQILDTENAECKKILSNISKVKETVQSIQTLIEKLLWSKERDETNFWISWWMYIEKNKQYYEFGYGKKFSSEPYEPVREIEFVYALLSWEKEICKRLVLLKVLQGDLYTSFCDDLESHLHNMIGFYIESCPS